MRRVSRKTTLTNVTLVASAVLVSAIAVSRTAATSADAADAQAAPASSPVAKGEYLVRTGGCHDCHTPWKLGDNGPDPADPPPVVGSSPAGLFVAAPVVLPATGGIVPPSSLPLSFTITVYDRALNAAAIPTTADPVEKVIAHNAEKLGILQDHGPQDARVESKSADPNVVSTQDDSRGRPVVIRVFVVNTEEASTTLVVSRAAGEAETHIAWSHYLRLYGRR